MNNKKGLILTIIALLTLTIFVVGATYAYFSAQGGASTSTNIKVTTSTTDLLTFNVGSDINIYADQISFGENKTSLNGTTTATATLTANNSTNNTTTNYYVYLNMRANTFKYTQNENTPELILTITGPDGELTSLDGYTYKTVTDIKGTSISGFDVTQTSGLITIANNEPITAGTKSTVAKATNSEEWTITLTFVNYNNDQTANAGNSMTAEVIIQKEKMKSTLANYVKSLYTGVQGENNIYYHNSELTNGAGDNSYRYAGAGGHPAYYSCTYDGNDVLNFEYYDINRTSEGDCSIVYKASFNDGEEDITEYYDNSFEKYFYNTTSVKWDSTNNKCVTESSIEVTDFSKNSVTEEKCVGTAYQYMDEELYVLGIIKLGAGVETLVSEAVEGVNNYVCFGSDEDTCSDDNLYRIIGVIDDKIKLIKATSLGNIEADSGGANTWSTSSLNEYLNGTYLNTFSEDWQSKIATTTWKVGGISEDSVIASTMYTNEMNSTAKGTDGLTEYSSKIALMYAHDYGFAASPTAWTTTLYTYDGNDSAGTSIKTIDWLFSNSGDEWLISRYSNSSINLHRVNTDGSVRGNSSVTNKMVVRPVFFLNSEIKYESGNGTSTSPYRIN